MSEQSAPDRERSTPAPDDSGFFGAYGGAFVPETVIPALEELAAAYAARRLDPAFAEELSALLERLRGSRRRPLYRANRLAEAVGLGAVYLKREDLCHTGAHKINNTLGQCLLAKRMGKKRVIAETGAGQHGVATATAAALMDLECAVFMGVEDIRRQALNVYKMRLLGAEVLPVEEGTGTLADAVTAALRHWVERVEDTFYVLGSAVGPHPYPMIVRDFQRVIGDEIDRAACREGRRARRRCGRVRRRRLQRHRHLLSVHHHRACREPPAAHRHRSGGAWRRHRQDRRLA